MERRRAAWAAVLVAVAACAALPAKTTANKIKVNWLPNTNYTGWEQEHGPFYKGDWLGTHARGYFSLYAFELEREPTRRQQIWSPERGRGRRCEAFLSFFLGPNTLISGRLAG